MNLEQRCAPACVTAQPAQVRDLEEGLAAAAWSRSQERLVVATEPGHVLLIDQVCLAPAPAMLSVLDTACMQDWDTVGEAELFARPTSVVPKRELTVEALPDSLQLGPADVHVSWRGDGQYFATCARTQAGRQQRTPVLEQHCFRELHLHLLPIARDPHCLNKASLQGPRSW